MTGRSGWAHSCAESPSVNIVRKFVVQAARLDDLATLHLTPYAARLVRASVVAGLNVVVAGGTQAGKPDAS